MGHARLYKLPNTKPWRRVVGHLADGATVGVVAGATTKAAARGLQLALGDKGMAHVLYLLAHTVMAARGADFEGGLAGVGVIVPGDPSVFDLTAGFSGACDAWHSEHRNPRSDLADLAELSATEALTRLVGDRSGQVIPTGDAVRNALYTLSTKNGFATLAHEYFATFARRFLHYHLDRELSHHTGGNGRFADRSARNSFAEDLAVHCREAALIVRDYAGDWYSKANFEDGISEKRARQFSRVCLGKLRDELLVRGEVARV